MVYSRKDSSEALLRSDEATTSSVSTAEEREGDFYAAEGMINAALLGAVMWVVVFLIVRGLAG